MLRFLVADANLKQILEELVREIPDYDALSGAVSLYPTDCGLRVEKNGEDIRIGYSDRRSLMRGIGILAERRSDACFDVREAPKYDILGAMPDASRNAVPKVETVKKLCRLLALEGYNAIMLYTEDTYELEGYPYFGHLRGRYTAEELRDMDDYAASLGLEMIPCIQTLAHLNAFFEWPFMESLRDCNDILLVGEEKVYDMIDRMLETVSCNIRSRRINIGLDEAFMLGCGHYLEHNGYHARSEIMLRHLKRVTDLCKKHGYAPRMWSDMFFRMQNNGVYRVKGAEIPPHIADAVPEEQTLVYWDYTQPNKDGYNEMFRQHRAFRNPIAFAGGDASWYGPVPLNRLGQKCALAAAESLEENGIREVYVTMWKDDGGECSIFSSITSLFIYAEACWGGIGEADLRAKRRVEALTGMDPEALLNLEEINNLPGRLQFGERVANPCKYMLYEGLLTGKFDCHIPDGSGAHLQKQIPWLLANAKKGGAYAYLFETLFTLTDVLAWKTEISKRLVKAYKEEDRETVGRIAAEEIPLLAEKVGKYHRAFRRQWMQENKSFGFDVMDIRLGGLLAQLETARMILEEWISGQRQRVEELEAPRLPYAGAENKGYDNGLIMVNRWERIAAQNISCMYGI